jgi:hypothetical protein
VSDPLGPAESRPPFGSWERLYALVVLDLILTIALCGWLSRLGS